MKDQKNSLVLARMAILVAGSMAALLIAEIVLRLFWENPFDGEDAMMVVELAIHPRNKDTRLDRSPVNSETPFVKFRTDARRYIEPAIRFAEPDYTIAFLGGSTTACLYVQEHLRFPALVSFLLEDKGILVNTLNAGRSGNDAHQSVNNLLNHIVSDDPDVAVFMHAANDIGNLKTSGSYEAVMGKNPDFGRFMLQKMSSYSSLVGMGRHARRLARNKAVLERKSKRERGFYIAFEKERFATDIPINEYKHRLRAFIYLCRAFDIIPVLMTQPSGTYRNELTPEWINKSNQAEFNQAIRDIAAQEKAELIDLVSYLNVREKQVGQFEEQVFYDGIHVSDYGSRLYAEHISERLHQIISKK